jgi:predicted nucleotidyltransferase
MNADERRGHPAHTAKRNYLEQTRELVLRITAELDCTVILFGSRARGEQRRNSDIDIGFSGLSEPEFTRVRDRLLSELEDSVIPHHVDLVNIDTVPGSFREVAMKKVIVWKQNSRAN